MLRRISSVTKVIIIKGLSGIKHITKEMYPGKLVIEPTKRSPWIVMEPGRIFIMGRSILETPAEFYEPGLKWIYDYAKSWSGKTKIDLGFEYINTGSIKWLYIIIRELSEIKNMASNGIITWYYEEGDEDMCELGHILRSLVECQFTIIEINDMNEEVYRGFLTGAR